MPELREKLERRKMAENLPGRVASLRLRGVRGASRAFLKSMRLP